MEEEEELKIEIIIITTIRPKEAVVTNRCCNECEDSSSSAE